MDEYISGLLEELNGGRITLQAACKMLDASVARHYEGSSRDSGVVYTPVAVARYICKRAIGSFIEKNGTDRLKSIRVFDSSCGTGIFLEAALEELYISRAEGAEKAALPEGIIKKEIVENNLYGMDLDPYSVAAAAFRLRLLLASAGSREPVRTNLSCNNALFVDGDDRYDVIVGNPPYMRIKSMSGKAKNEIPAAVRMCGLYHYQEGNLNLYKLFIERNLAFLNDNGSMGLIIPSSFLNEATSEKLRRHVFATCSLQEVIEIPERSRIFRGVNQATVVLILNKSSSNGGHFTLRSGIRADDMDGDSGSISIDYGELAGFTDGRMEVPLLTDPSLEWDMMRRLKGIAAFKGGNGIAPVGEISVGNVDETFDKAYISEEPTGEIFVKGIHLKEYFVDLSPDGKQPRWVKKEAFLKAKPSARPALAHWRIIGRNTQNKACARRLKFALLPPGYLCSNSIKQIVVTDPGMDPLYLLGLLNSSTLNWYFELFCSQNNIRNYRIEALPIVRASSEVQSAFAGIARLIMESGGSRKEFLDKGLMDSMAYELYYKGREASLIDHVCALSGSCEDVMQKRLISDPQIIRKINDIWKEAPFEIVRNAAYDK